MLLGLVKRFAKRVRQFFSELVLDQMRIEPQGPDAASQIQLMLTYRRLIEDKRPLPRFSDIGFKCHSQCDEDGILLFLFSVIGTTNKLSVEICAGDGIECNTTNLILNHGWHGLLVDGSAKKVDKGIAYFQTSKHSYVYPPRFVCTWIKRGTINHLLTSNGFTGEIDLLSLDLDGVDYWIWEAMDAISPRVVVVEYQCILGPDRAWTVPYADDFTFRNYPSAQGPTGGMPNFFGASLMAFVKLARKKGYRLVCVNRLEFNAFFVKSGIADRLLPEIEPRDCFTHPKVLAGMRDDFPAVRDMPWIEV